MPAKANLTDDELREYVAQHPDAKLAEMCRHYGWNKDRLATRLKRIGLSLPGDSGKLGGTPPGVGRERTDNKTIRIAEDPTQKPWQEPVPGELPFPRDMLEAAVKEFRGFTPEQAARYGYLGPLAGLLKHRQDQILAWKDYSAQLKGQVSRLSSLRTSDQTRLRNLEYQLKCENEEDQKRDARVATANKQMDTSAQQLKSANDRCGELQSRVTKLETEVVEAREHRKQELETTFSPEAMQTAETIAKMHARSPILKERFHSSSAAGAAALHLLETLPTEVATYSEVINKLNSERRQYRGGGRSFIRLPRSNSPPAGVHHPNGEGDCERLEGRGTLSVCGVGSLRGSRGAHSIWFESPASPSLGQAGLGANRTIRPRDRGGRDCGTVQARQARR